MWKEDWCTFSRQYLFIYQVDQKASNIFPKKCLVFVIVNCQPHAYRIDVQYAKQYRHEVLSFIYVEVPFEQLVIYYYKPAALISCMHFFWAAIARLQLLRVLSVDQINFKRLTVYGSNCIFIINHIAKPNKCFNSDFLSVLLFCISNSLIKIRVIMFCSWHNFNIMFLQFLGNLSDLRIWQPCYHSMACARTPAYTNLHRVFFILVWRRSRPIRDKYWALPAQ